MKKVLFLALLLPVVAQGGPISFAQVAGLVFGDGSLVTVVDDTSPSYFAALDSNNLGSLGWTYTNTTGAPLSNVTFFGFLDADIDRLVNGYSNEYGELIGLSLPPGTPLGALSTTSWEIDEPGFVFGDIITNLLQGSLDNTNSVPASSPDDVSLALGFAPGDLAPNATLTATFQISRSNIAGLRQVDPASDYDFYFNGYTTISTPATSDSPEPATFVLMGFGFGGIAIIFRRLRAPIPPVADREVS